MVESKDSGNDALELSIEDVMKIAEEEIKRTSEEAVKAAVLEIGGELAFESERANQLELRNSELELFNRELQSDLNVEKKKYGNRLFLGALLGGAGGVIISSVVFSICQGFIK